MRKLTQQPDSQLVLSLLTSNKIRIGQQWSDSVSLVARGRAMES